MLGFIRSFESIAFGLGQQAMNSGGGQQARTRIIRQTSKRSSAAAADALRAARSQRDIARMERDLAHAEIRRLQAIIAARR